MQIELAKHSVSFGVAEVRSPLQPIITRSRRASAAFELFRSELPARRLHRLNVLPHQSQPVASQPDVSRNTLPPYVRFLAGIRRVVAPLTIGTFVSGSLRPRRSPFRQGYFLSRPGSQFTCTRPAPRRGRLWLAGLGCMGGDCSAAEETLRPLGRSAMIWSGLR